MPVPFAFDDATPDSPLRPGAACRRSSLSPAVRFAIFFGVLFALKLALPYTNVSATIQVVVLAGAATLLVWRFWWACGESRRGGVMLIAILWLAALAKIIVQPQNEPWIPSSRVAADGRGFSDVGQRDAGPATVAFAVSAIETGFLETPEPRTA